MKHAMLTSMSDRLLVFGTRDDVAREPVTQDPLGFRTTSEGLADVFAPGLTVSTRSVRYYQLLAAGVAADAGGGDPRNTVMRLERIWALASYLSNPGNGELPGSGLAGISRVRGAASGRSAKLTVSYRMFQGDGQARQGVWGLYRRSAEQLLFVDGQVPTALGSRIAGPMESAMDRGHLRRAALGTLKTATRQSLASFGRSAGLFTPIDRETADAAWEALRADPNRREAAKALRTGLKNQEALLARLAKNAKFAVAARAAQSLEEMFAALTRLLDAAVTLAQQASAVDQREFRGNSVLVGTLNNWKGAAIDRCEALARCDVVDPGVVTLGLEVAASRDPWNALEMLIGRHHQVQEAKGRQPWLHWRSGHLVRGAASPLTDYNPFDPAHSPHGHDLRLLNLRSMAIEIDKAGAKLK